MEGENTAKAILRPRNPGESIKVAETVLKRRDRNLKAAAERAKQNAKVRKQRNEHRKGKLNIVRAEILVKNQHKKQMDRNRIKHSKKKFPKGPKRVGGGCKTIIACRNGRSGGCIETKATLKKLGLGDKNTMIFLPNTPDVAAKLLTCKPFCYWGKISYKSLMNIVHKKAMFRSPESPGEKVLLSDNTLIEKHLGDVGVLCTEDLAHTLWTNDQNFEAVTKRLWPIRIGEIRKTSGLIKETGFTQGNLQDAMDMKLTKLLGD